MWLLKTEPEVFSIDDLQTRGHEPWDGVRNYQARNFLQAMRAGDYVFIYHSNAKPSGIVGVGRIIGEARVDPGQFDAASEYYDAAAKPEKPRWYLRDVAFVCKFPRILSLEELRNDPKLEGLECCRRGSRLSVHPVSPAHFKHILSLLNIEL